MGKEKGLIEIRITGLSEGVYEYEFTCKASDFKNPELTEPAFNGEIRTRIVANKTGGEIAVDIETKTLAEFTCDICLAPLKKELTGFYKVLFVYGDLACVAEENAENYRVLDRNASVIDLTEDVRETLLLSRPMKVVCADNPECSVHRENLQQLSDTGTGAKSPWKESLEKLKNKYH